MAVFCAVEATLFGSLIASYFYLRDAGRRLAAARDRAARRAWRRSS
jgi:heme/copper-type cytochrome/quinol oxidase subunit 3